MFLTQNSWGILFQEKKVVPNSENPSHNFIVWNSEIIGFDFTEKSLYFIKEKFLHTVNIL